MRILVSTLYCGENEFEACCHAIEHQTYRDFEHKIYHHLPNLEAHERLFSDFEQSADFDLLIKIDADMVIRENTFFEKVVSIFKENPAIDLMEIELWDCYTDRQIPAINAIRARSSYQRTSDAIFTDLGDVPAENRLYDKDNLAPAADHCPDPSDLQAFRYGVHKGVKVLQKGRLIKFVESARGHLETVNYLRQKWINSRELRYLYAWLGAEQALLGHWQIEHLDIGGSVLPEHLENLKKRENSEVLSEAKEFFELRQVVPHQDVLVLLWQQHDPMLFQDICFFGASSMGKDALAAFKGRVEPQFFVDNDPSKWGNEIEGISIYSPEKLQQNPPAQILITSIYHTEIRQQIMDLFPDKTPQIEIYHG